MSDLDQLKELLFGAEKQALNSIAERVERREVRTVDVADILPEAIHQSYQKDAELVESLTQPVGECLQQAFRDDPQTYGDALYPVMGPAIRKSIMHALRTFTQQISEAVEHSVSAKGLKWRWQAARAGVPFGEYVLQKTMRYRVEQAYLISRENGLLVGHVHHQASKIKDSDAVSAMFTAIQDFVKESFSPDRTGRLESADMGEFTLWAVHGPHALLVCVIRGVPPQNLRADLSAILERIHFRYGEAIREYKGDTSSVPDVEVELERCLRFEAREESSKTKKGLPVALIIFLLLLVSAVAFVGVRSWMYSQQLEDLDAALGATPGIYVTGIDRNGADFEIRGLKDPLATEVIDVAESIDIPAERLNVSMQPFQSLQPEMLVARAAQMFGKPESVNLDVTGTTLVATGDAPWAWRQQLRSRFRNLAGVESLDVSGLTSSDRQQFADHATALAQRKFFFRRGVDFVEGNEDGLNKYGRELGALQEEAAKFDYSVSVTLKASTDSSGGAVINTALADRRATLAAGILSAAGVDRLVVGQPDQLSADDGPREDVSRRYVQVDAQLQSLPEQP
jgi:OOP family OmpA-OmpF porin